MATKQKRSYKNRSRKNRSRKIGDTFGKNRSYKGGNINIPARYYYPLNTFSHDPQRDIQTSQMKGGCGCGMKGGCGCGMKGGCGCGMKGGRKNHTRKYLKGGSFFSSFAKACEAGNIDAAKLLLQLKPDINVSAYNETVVTST